jgi:hypothetical protein
MAGMKEGLGRGRTKEVDEGSEEQQRRQGAAFPFPHAVEMLGTGTGNGPLE